MTSRILFTICILLGTSSTGVAGGDPFYFSTWYAQPSPSLAWSSQSVMSFQGGGYPFTSIGAISPSSPRYFAPGYGYSTQRSFSAATWSAYQPAWSYGVLQPSSVSTGLFGTSGSSEPLIVPGTVHTPWYLPGSPGNVRSPLTRP